MKIQVDAVGRGVDQLSNIPKGFVHQCDHKHKPVIKPFLFYFHV